MTLPRNACLECAGLKYDDEGLPCEACNGNGAEPIPDPLSPHPCADPVVRAILAMGEGER